MWIYTHGTGNRLYEKISQISLKDLNYTQAIMDVIYLLFSFFVTLQAQSQPNIVFIFIDDLGWNDVGFHGSEIMVHFLQS